MGSEVMCSVVKRLSEWQRISRCCHCLRRDGRVPTFGALEKRKANLKAEWPNLRCCCILESLKCIPVSFLTIFEKDTLFIVLVVLKTVLLFLNRTAISL